MIKAFRTRTWKERVIGDRDFLYEVLKEFNTARRATGLRALWRMPKGTPAKSLKCPTALAINHGLRVTGSNVLATKDLGIDGQVALGQIAAAWGVETFSSRRGDMYLRLNPSENIRTFITRFDIGHFSQLRNDDQ